MLLPVVLSRNVKSKQEQFPPHSGCLLQLLSAENDSVENVLKLEQISTYFYYTCSVLKIWRIEIKMFFKKIHTTQIQPFSYLFLSSLTNLCNSFLKTLKSIPMPDMGLAVSTQKMSSSEESGNPTAFSYLLFSNKTKVFSSSYQSVVSRNAGFDINTRGTKLIYDLLCTIVCYLHR